MRLKAVENLSYAGRTVLGGHAFNADNEAEGLSLINQDLAVPFNLEDPDDRAPDAPGPPLPPELTVSLNPAGASVPADAASYGFSVTLLNNAPSWTVTKDPSAAWLTIDSPAGPQTADGTVAYSVTDNAAGPARATELNVNDVLFEVSQADGSSVVPAQGTPPAKKKRSW